MTWAALNQINAQGMNVVRISLLARCTTESQQVWLGSSLAQVSLFECREVAQRMLHCASALCKCPTRLLTVAQCKMCTDVCPFLTMQLLTSARTKKVAKDLLLFCKSLQILHITTPVPQRVERTPQKLGNILTSTTDKNPQPRKNRACTSSRKSPQLLHIDHSDPSVMNLAEWLRSHGAKICVQSRGMPVFSGKCAREGFSCKWACASVLVRVCTCKCARASVQKFTREYSQIYSHASQPGFCKAGKPPKQSPKHDDSVGSRRVSGKKHRQPRAVELPWQRHEEWLGRLVRLVEQNLTKARAHV